MCCMEIIRYWLIAVSYTHLDVYKRQEYLYEQTDITVKCQEHDFKARGKIPVQMGFKEVEKAFKHLYVCLLYTSQAW